METPHQLEEASSQIKQAGTDLGFDLVGIAPAVSPEGFVHLEKWLDAGYAGEMSYMERRREAYATPENVQQNVKSLVLCAWNYRSEEPTPPQPTQGRVARYAWSGIDYHDYLRKKLKQFSIEIQTIVPSCRTRCAVDTAPLLERDFSRLAGLGWFGKNTMLINKQKGSWLLLGSVLVDQELAYDAPHHTSHCGTCTRCLDACPTDAFVAPYELDARKCLSYLTIESRSSISQELREPMKDWLFGCDVCQDVCPWNSKSPPSTALEVQPRFDLNPLSAIELFTLSEAELQQKLGKSPLLRPGREGLLRNAAIVLGNSRDSNAIFTLCTALAEEESPLVRGSVAWALGQFSSEKAKKALKERLLIEKDIEVRVEIETAINQNASK